MSYDYFIIIGVLTVVVGAIVTASRMLDERSTLSGIATVVLGAGLIYYGWLLSDKSLVPQDFPDAFMRIMGSILN